MKVWEIHKLSTVGLTQIFLRKFKNKFSGMRTKTHGNVRKTLGNYELISNKHIEIVLFKATICI